MVQDSERMVGKNELVRSIYRNDVRPINSDAILVILASFRCAVDHYRERLQAISLELERCQQTEGNV